MVTGGAGFIGSHVVRRLVRRYPDYLVVNVDKLTYAGNLENLADIADAANYRFERADVANMAAMEGMMRRYSIDGIIHLAAESHVDRSIRDPFTFARTNVMGTLSLLESARRVWSDTPDKFQGKRFHHVSTDEVYGALEMGKGMFTEDTRYDPHSPYSASKASSDHFVRAYHDTYGLPAVVTNCSNNYGPYQFPEKLIPLLINNAKQHKNLPVYGDGMQIRDWLYVMDHCKAIDMVCNGGKVGEVYNVGGHNERPNIFIVKTVIEQLHDRLKDEGISEELIKHVADRLGHDRRYGIDPTKIKNDLGWYPETPFEKGIVLTIDWYLNHQEWMDHVTSGDYQNYYQDMYKNK